MEHRQTQVCLRGTTAAMVSLTPPWARRPERCPNCLDPVLDDLAVVCDRCGYQLRMPRVSLVGLFLIALGIGSLLVSAFGGFLIPWIDLPFLRPLIGSPTPEDLATWYLWLGVVTLLLGIAAASAGAYAARRETERVVAQARRPA